jgi:hypothetical protein
VTGPSTQPAFHPCFTPIARSLIANLTPRLPPLPPVFRPPQDDVPSFPDEQAFAIMEAQLGRPLEEVFSSISTKPVAAASLGQVPACGLGWGWVSVSKGTYREELWHIRYALAPLAVMQPDELGLGVPPVLGSGRRGGALPVFHQLSTVYSASLGCTPPTTYFCTCAACSCTNPLTSQPPASRCTRRYCVRRARRWRSR